MNTRVSSFASERPHLELLDDHGQPLDPTTKNVEVNPAGVTVIIPKVEALLIRLLVTHQTMIDGMFDAVGLEREIVYKNKYHKVCDPVIVDGAMRHVRRRSFETLRLCNCLPLEDVTHVVAISMLRDYVKAMRMINFADAGHAMHLANEFQLCLYMVIRSQSTDDERARGSTRLKAALNQFERRNDAATKIRVVVR